jgi:adenosylcobinamide-GDP ribazoletransferase
MFWQTLRAALVFYSCLPLGNSQTLDFRGIAVYAPVVGVLIGSMMGALDYLLEMLSGSKSEVSLLRACLVVLAGVLLTGGLHLDGAMDSADGLAVNDPARRLEVMADSATGAYGAIAALAILLIKIAALVAISRDRIWVLMAVAAWGRWGQLRAIAAYPYLKATGKGKFHQADIHTWQVWLVGTGLAIGSLAFGIAYQKILFGVIVGAIGFGFAWGIGAWFNRQLGGHTGDTYGATVEWTEALSLAAIAFFQ